MSGELQRASSPASTRALARAAIRRDSALRGGRRYRTELSVEEFARLLDAHPRVALLDGVPSRAAQQRAGAEITAWRTDESAFVLAPVPPDRHELEPPALHLRFEPDGTLHMQASLSLAAEFDAALRNWIDRFGLFVAGSMFFVGAYLGSVVLLAIVLSFVLPLLGMSEVLLFPLASALALIPAWWSSRFTRVFRFERASERAWRLALPSLHRVAGELVTPHTLGAASSGAPQPYRVRRRRER